MVVCSGKYNACERPCPAGFGEKGVRRVGLTEEGQAVFESCWKNVMQSEKAILEQFPEAHRAMLIEFLHQLNQAATCWQAGK